MSRIVSVLAAVALFVAVGSAQGTVSGAWDLSINGPEGPITAAATLKQDGEKVTGSIESPQGTAELTGSIKGKTIAITFQIAGPQGPLDIKVDGEVDGASMKGIINFGMGTADFTAKKK
jgi:hypothetical protein